jgi:hypothetical protein
VLGKVFPPFASVSRGIFSLTLALHGSSRLLDRQDKFIEANLQKKKAPRKKLPRSHAFVPLISTEAKPIQ